MPHIITVFHKKINVPATVCRHENIKSISSQAQHSERLVCDRSLKIKR